MRKFCTKCGRKLDKDEVCTCEKIKKENREIKTDINIIDKISEFLKTPCKTLKNLNFLDGNEYIILLLSSLSFGFFKYFIPFGRYFRSFVTAFLSLSVFVFQTLFII